MTIGIGVFGASGRVGRKVIEVCAQDGQFEIVSAMSRAAKGIDAGVLAGVGTLGVEIVENIDLVVGTADVCIDFTHPSATKVLLQSCVGANKPLVIGTTGFNSEALDDIGEAAHHIPIVQAPNMSVGVNLCFSLIAQAAKALGDDVDIEIIEAHHRNKLDAPSGTAVKMGEVIAEVLGRDLSQCAVYGREGQVGARDRSVIGFETIRGGDIVGEHTVLFAGDGERVEISHRSSTRMNFARGALRAAKWLLGKRTGLFTMRDVLGLA